MERGREESIAALGDLLRVGRPVGVLGEAGIGTTTVLDAVAARAGGEVLRCGALRSLRDLPFLALNRGLRTDLAGDPSALEGQLVTRVGSGVLIIDDLQWADPHTLDSLPAIARTVRLLVGIRRGDDGERTARVALAGSGGVLVPLDPLGSEECSAIIRRERPEIGDEELSSLLRNCAGNPGVLRQLLAIGSVSTPLVEALRTTVQHCDQETRVALALVAGSPDGLAAIEVGAPLDRLLDSGLVTLAEKSVHLRHAVSGEAAFDSLDPRTRASLHRRLAGLATDPSQHAEHLLAAGDPDAALPCALAAVEAASDATRSTALERAARCATGARRAALLADAADAALTMGDRSRARRLAEAALAVTDAPPTDRVLATVAETRARDGAADGAIEAADRVTEQASRHDRARALAASAFAFAWPLWRPTEAVERAAQARRASDPADEQQLVLAALGVARLVSGDDAWAESYEQLGAATRRLGALLEGWGDRAAVPTDRGSSVEDELLDTIVAFHTTGDCDGVAARLHGLIERLERPVDLELARTHLSLALSDSGRTSAAADIASAALRSDPSPAGRALLGWALTEAELTAGRLTKARTAFDRLDLSFPSPPVTLATVAATWAATGSPSGSSPLPTRGAPSPWAGLAAADLELAALSLRAEAAGVADAAAAARQDAAFTDAAAAWAGWHRRGELRCRWAAADSACAGADPDEAIERLRAIEVEAARLGQRPLIARVRTSLRGAGIRTRPHRGDGRGPLSAREVEVLELVRLGFTSGEAAQSLGVAPSTVDTQVESAMRKLGARTRLHAAALVAELAT